MRPSLQYPAEPAGHSLDPKDAQLQSLTSAITHLGLVRLKDCPGLIVK